MKRIQFESDPHVETKKQRMEIDEPDIIRPAICSRFRHIYGGIIFSIFPIDSDTAIVHRLFATTNEIVNKNGLLLRTLAHNQKFNCFVRSGKGEFLASSLYTCCIKKFDFEGKTWDFLNIAPFRPCSMYTRPDGKTLIAAINADTSKPGLVLEFHEQGEMIRQTEIDKEEFGRGPMRITENASGDICVLTTLPDASPHAIKVFSKDWVLKAQYHGENLDRSFRPLGLCYDKYGNILVANTDSNEVIMLDGNCQFRQILLSKDDGISAPRCLSKDPSGHIWLGCEDGYICVFDY